MADKHTERAHQILEKVADGEIEPTGVVTLEMRDADTGKIVDKESAPNFIAKTWKTHARALLRTRWMQLGYNRQFTGMTAIATATQNWPYLASTIPTLPADSIACWNQTSAEDAANEHTPNIPATGIVAWASRWPFGSATGPRGNVSTAAVDSFTDDDTVRHVFDWTSTQGNGTFRSVGWLRMGAPGIHLAGFGTHHRARSVGTWTPASHITGATSLAPSNAWVDPATGTAYVLIRRQATSGIMRVVSFSAAAALDDNTLTTLGVNADSTLSLTNVTSEFTPTSSFTGGETVHAVLGRVAGGTVFAYGISSSTGNTHRWGVVTDGTATSTTYNFPTTGFISGIVIGTTLYAASGQADSNIYALNTSTGATINTIPIDSAVTTLCTLAGLTTPRIVAMTTDGTNLFVMYSGTDSSAANILLVELGVSGTLIRSWGTVPHTQPGSNLSETASSPYSGTWVFPRSYWAKVDDYGPFTIDSSGATSTVEDIFSSNLGPTGDATAQLLPGHAALTAVRSAQFLNYYDGSLFLGAFNASSGYIASAAAVSWYRQGYDLGSRVLLASSRTKTVGQTMRITYDITLPGWF